MTPLTVIEGGPKVNNLPPLPPSPEESKDGEKKAAEEKKEDAKAKKPIVAEV